MSDDAGQVSMRQLAARQSMDNHEGGGASSGSSIPATGQGIATNVGGEIGATFKGMDVSQTFKTSGVGDELFQKMGGALEGNILDGVAGNMAPAVLRENGLDSLGAQGAEMPLSSPAKLTGELSPAAISGTSPSKASEGRG